MACWSPAHGDDNIPSPASTVLGKFTIASRLTFLQAIRQNIHPALGIFFIVALGINVSGSIMGVMGIAADVLQEWSKDWTEGGISSLVWASSITLFIIRIIRK